MPTDIVRRIFHSIIPCWRPAARVKTKGRKLYKGRKVLSGLLNLINDKLIEKESPLNQYGLYIMGEVCITIEITIRNKSNH